MNWKFSPIKCLLVTALISLTGFSAIAKNDFLSNRKIIKGEFPFSEAVKVDEKLYMSGMIGLDPRSGDLVSGGISAETKQAMENIQSVLEANGYSLNEVIKCTAMLTNIKDWSIFNDIYKTYFKAEKYPARSVFGVSGLALNAQIELECIASK